jgi:hypothetical protein
VRHRYGDTWEADPRCETKLRNFLEDAGVAHQLQDHHSHDINKKQLGYICVCGVCTCGKKKMEKKKMKELEEEASDISSESSSVEILEVCPTHTHDTHEYSTHTHTHKEEERWDG